MAPGLGLLQCPDELQRACQVACLHQADIEDASLSWQAMFWAASALIGQQKNAFQTVADLAGGQQVKAALLVSAAQGLKAFAGTDGRLCEALADAQVLAVLATALLAAEDLLV